MLPGNPIIEQMATYALVLLTGIVIHEVLHYAAALMLGKQPKLTLSVKGPMVWLPDYSSYRAFSQLPTLRMKIDYTLISLAPYLILPLYIHLAHTTLEPGAKLAFATLASMHIAAVITEFEQSNVAMGIASLIALLALYILAP